jgi:hypothetical protein
MLEMTTPGRMMIWLAENQVTRYTLQLKAKLLLQIIKAGLIGNWKFFRRLVLDFAIWGHVDCDCHNHEAGKHHVGTKLRKLLRASRVIACILLFHI